MWMRWLLVSNTRGSSGIKLRRKREMGIPSHMYNWKHSTEMHLPHLTTGPVKSLLIGCFHLTVIWDLQGEICISRLLTDYKWQRITQTHTPGWTRNKKQYTQSKKTLCCAWGSLPWFLAAGYFLQDIENRSLTCNIQHRPHSSLQQTGGIKVSPIRLCFNGWM